MSDLARLAAAWIESAGLPSIGLAKDYAAALEDYIGILEEELQDARESLKEEQQAADSATKEITRLRGAIEGAPHANSCSLIIELGDDYAIEGGCGWWLSLKLGR